MQKIGEKLYSATKSAQGGSDSVGEADDKDKKPEESAEGASDEKKEDSEKETDEKTDDGSEKQEDEKADNKPEEPKDEPKSDENK